MASADELIAMFSTITTDDHSSLKAQFSRILKCDAGVAAFFLESSNWNVEVAVNNFVATAGDLNNLYRPTERPRVMFKSKTNFPEGGAVPPGKELMKQLLVHNPGGPWPRDTEIVFADGVDMGGPRRLAFNVDPKKEKVAAICFRAPRKPGSYAGQWRFRTGEGYFGDPIWIIIQVTERPPSEDRAPLGPPPAEVMREMAARSGPGPASSPGPARPSVGIDFFSRGEGPAPVGEPLGPSLGGPSLGPSRGAVAPPSPKAPAPSPASPSTDFAGFLGPSRLGAAWGAPDSAPPPEFGAWGGGGAPAPAPAPGPAADMGGSFLDAAAWSGSAGAMPSAGGIFDSGPRRGGGPGSDPSGGGGGGDSMDM